MQSWTQVRKAAEPEGAACQRPQRETGVKRKRTLGEIQGGRRRAPGHGDGGPGGSSSSSQMIDGVTGVDTHAHVWTDSKLDH